MIKKANLILSKTEPVRLEEIARLEQLKAQNNEVLQQELAQRATLAEIEARLFQTANFNEAELRSTLVACNPCIHVSLFWNQ